MASRDSSDEFLRLACLTYGERDSPGSRARACEMWARTPALASAGIHAASVIGDADAARALLAADPNVATEPGGPFAWAPLLYAAYSRLDSEDPRHSTLEVSRLLLDHGADPNAHFWWGGQYRFTALTGAFGQGELGPNNQPPHADCRALAELLLGRGADPNDSQALYNTMFRRGTDCLELLLAHGLGPEQRNNWLVHDGQGKPVPHPETTLRYQLRWACEHGHLDRVKLLVEHGVDFRTPFPSEETAWETATRCGYLAVARYLAENGAASRAWSPVEQLAGALTAADATTARALIAQSRQPVAEVARANPGLLLEAARLGPVDAVALMLDVGLDRELEGQPGAGVTPLHEAAWHGQLETVKLLVARGADPTVLEPLHNGTPLDWARHGGFVDVVEWFESLQS